MKSKVCLLVTLLLSTLLTGCGFVPINLETPKPYIESWRHPTLSAEQRHADAVSCGLKDPNYGRRFNQEEINASRLPSEKDMETYYRLGNVWQRCMLKKGYLWNGDCNGEIARTRPACGAP
jgi:hypothetical protein